MRYLSIDTGKQISKIGLGTWQFGSKKWGYGERYAREEAGAIVRRAVGLPRKADVVAALGSAAPGPGQYGSRE